MKANGKTAYCTVLTPDFVPGFYVFLHSLLESNPSFQFPLIVFYNPEYKDALSKEFPFLEKIYNKLEFREVKTEKYNRLALQRDTAYRTPGRLKEAFYIIEAFGVTGFDKIIAIDCDMIVLGSLDELLELEAPFSACRAYDYSRNMALPYFNTGLMVINRSLLDGKFYSYLLETLQLEPRFRYAGKADQAILNQVLGENASYIETRFNTTKRKYSNVGSVEDFETILAQDGTVILHYVGQKPWKVKVQLDDLPYVAVEKFWWKKLFQYADAQTRFQFVNRFVESQFEADIPYVTRPSNPIKDFLRPFKHKVIHGCRKIKGIVQ
ncbi:MAG: hypothetical protein KDD46_07045 [Bdellovibrionales bacterium]|nr:hypothetical protein [Bdellovibrionales bacterium]